MRNLFQLCPRLPAGSNEKTGELYLKSEPRERCWLVQRSTQVPVTAVSTTTKLQFNAAFLVILIFACRSSCLVLMLPFIYMPFLMIVQKSVSCTALNLSLPEFLLPAGFNSDSLLPGNGWQTGNIWQDEKRAMKKLKRMWFLKQLASQSATLPWNFQQIAFFSFHERFETQRVKDFNDSFLTHSH